MNSLPPPPALLAMTHIDCEVKTLVTLGPGPYGERRYIPLGGGTVRGPELNGTLVEGGVDWQINRADGVLDIAAHYVIRADDGALIEVQSNGLRHGPRSSARWATRPWRPTPSAAASSASGMPRSARPSPPTTPG